MKKVDFDKYQENYNELLQKQVNFFDKDDSYFSEYKINLVKRHTKKIREPLAVLEYGCGIGRNLKFLQRFFPGAQIYGCDISEKSLAAAAKENPNVRLFTTASDIEEGKFDLIFIANVLHHIVPELRLTVMQDIERMLGNDGALFVFEHNPYNPVTRHLVNTCPFDEDAMLVKPANMKKLAADAGFDVIKLNYTLFFPAALKYMRFLEPLLAHLPLGGQYFVHARKQRRR